MPRDPRQPAPLAALAVCLVGAGNAGAQPQASAPAAPLEFQAATQRAPWHPVDQTVSDLDPHAVSFRRVELGLAQFSHRTSLYRYEPVGPLSPAAARGANLPGDGRVYEIRVPGITARFDKPEYLVRVRFQRPAVALNQAPRFEGEFIEMIPPNTVFSLIPAHRGPVVDPWAEPDPADARTPARLDTRIDGRVPAPPPDAAGPFPAVDLTPIDPAGSATPRRPQPVYDGPPLPDPLDTPRAR